MNRQLKHTVDIRTVFHRLEDRIGVYGRRTCSGSEASLSEIAREIDANKSTTRRILKAMVATGFVIQDPVQRTYRPGLVLFELGQVVAEQMEIRKAAHPILKMLSEVTEETVHLSVLDNGEVFCLDKVDSPQPIRLVSKIGARGPAYATGSGKALLAYLDDESLQQLLKSRPLESRTERTITDVARLMEELETVRERGYALDDGESQEQVRCVAAPVHDYTGRVIASISVTGPEARLPLERLRSLSTHVKAAAEELSRRLGFGGREKAVRE
ncbi:IclR family transcriptional regulator [Limnochorda pilosa]|uniref:IclR family transcriptional regulator n=1 Tax=Limnochorda pilosa TaxID=1555112 RepID=A0A0K2SLP8_LIMPI|nr:IclR family transcriptional regulator [Limnochorda pilosa]BAS28051.1 IclR family transcriptional regulator [Limnochorda pilosa]